MKGNFLRDLGLYATILLFVAVAAAAVWGLGRTGASASEQGLEATERMVRRAVVECYALEGAYPPDLDYLEAHYGIRIDAERYYVYYRAYGQNIMPEIAVGALA